MSEGEKAPINTGKTTAAVVLLAIVLALLLYYFNQNIIAVICLPILVFGFYEVASSYARSSTPDRYGTSQAGAAIFWGFLAIAIGFGGIVYAYAHSAILAAVAFLLIMVVFIFVKKK